MMIASLKFVLSWFIELGILGVILYFNLRWFLFFALVLLIVVIHRVAEYLRRLVRYHGVMLDAKLIAIMTKLNINDDEFAITMQKTKEVWGETAWTKFEKESAEL